MAKTIWDYRVTQPYGYDPNYPLNNGYHRGIDYGAPDGTPVTVNGVTIALSGHTGAVTGPHSHVGRFAGGQATNPSVGGGKTITNAIVSEVGSNNTNGKFVKVLDGGDGATWVFLHNSDILVTKGQKLEGNNMATDALTKEEIIIIYQLAFDNDEVPQNLTNAYTGKALAGLLQQLQADPSYKAHKNKVNNPSTPGFKPAGELFVKG